MHGLVLRFNFGKACLLGVHACFSETLLPAGKPDMPTNTAPLRYHTVSSILIWHMEVSENKGYLILGSL